MLAGIFATLFWRHADRLKIMEGEIAAMKRTGDNIKSDLRQLISDRITEARDQTESQINELRTEIRHDIEAHAKVSNDNFIKLDQKLDTLIFRGMK